MSTHGRQSTNAERGAAAKPPHVRLDASLARAAAVLRDHDTDRAVVVDARGRAVGLLTARSLCLAALRCNKPLSDLRVETAVIRTVPAGFDAREELRDFVKYAIEHARAEDGHSAARSRASDDAQQRLQFVRVSLSPDTDAAARRA